jgi:hypothetical protein
MGAQTATLLACLEVADAVAQVLAAVAGETAVLELT